jgi:anti-sigma regulatory factor (Ser/Thr protein kinase)
MASAELPTSPTDTGFVRTVSADPHTVSGVRDEFSRWLRDRFTLDPVRFSDIVLAVNEAMANVAEFAYPSGTQDPLLSVRAQRDAVGDGIVVTIADRGRWREVDPADRCLTRGRGIPLMRALADRFRLEPSANGTRVDLQFDGCPLAATA